MKPPTTLRFSISFPNFINQNSNPKIEIPNFRKTPFILLQQPWGSNTTGDGHVILSSFHHLVLAGDAPHLRLDSALTGISRFEDVVLAVIRESWERSCLCLLIHFSSHSSWEIRESQNQATKTKLKKRREKKISNLVLLCLTQSPLLYNDPLSHSLHRVLSISLSLFFFFLSGARTLCRDVGWSLVAVFIF